MYTELQRLQDAGLNMSAVARLAIRKCVGMPLDAVSDESTPKRILIYISRDDSATLEQIVAREGARSKSSVLRKLISTYLSINAASIDAMF